MSAGQPVEAGAIDVELFEHLDPSVAGLEQGGLGRDDVVVGEATPVEAVANQPYGTLGLWQGLFPDPPRLAGPSGKLDLQARDLTFSLDAGGGQVAFRRQTLGAGAINGSGVLVIATQRDRATDHEAQVLPFPEMPDADADRGILGAARLFDRDPSSRDVALGDEDVQVSLCDAIDGDASRAGVLERALAQAEIYGAFPEFGQRNLSDAGFDLGLIEVDLGLGQFSLGPCPGEQGIAGHVDAALDLGLKLFGQIQALARDGDLGFSGQGLSPGALNLLQPVQPADARRSCDQSPFTTGQRDAGGSVAAAFDPLLITKRRFGPAQDVAAADCGEILDHKAQGGVGPDIRLAHSSLACPGARLRSCLGRIGRGGPGQGLGKRQVFRSSAFLRDDDGRRDYRQ